MAITADKIKAKSREALLEMAKAWEKEGKIQHAINAYEEVIGIAPESKEADQARDAILEIARRYEKEGKKHSAFYLYHKFGEGLVGMSKRPAK